MKGPIKETFQPKKTKIALFSKQLLKIGAKITIENGCRALLRKCRVLLPGCRSLLWRYRALLQRSRSLLHAQNTLISKHILKIRAKIKKKQQN